MLPPLPRTSPAPPRFAADLARHGQRTALVGDGGPVTYEQLAARVADVAAQLGPAPRLVLLEAAHTVEAVVGYLGALTAGSPVLLVPPTATASLTAAYDPDVVLLAGDRWRVRERRAGSAHELHPDLALLLSTSGSTGSPKLVRLSHENLHANATAIADYLGIRETDVAASTLPMGYCYGLSVLNSHLERGAAMVLTDLSVVDACFWELFREHGVSTLAGVPHTFDLLDRVGFAELDLPSLRYVTQAGGRLAPDRIRRYAELGRRSGWDLFVMYGQTEATARMAYLPPELALTRPGCIGQPIPGGSFALEGVDAGGVGVGVGELVYDGPNVMLGYATGRDDLALGRTLQRLRTGDLARRHDDGLYEVVGRRSRISKVFGLRIDLARVEEQLASLDVSACCVGGDGELVVVAQCAASETRRLATRTAGIAGLPVRAVRLVPVDVLPRLENGKPDLQTAAHLAAPATAPAPVTPAADLDGLCTLYAEVLGRDVGPDDTFVGLGGDSLSYVEMSLRLEDALGTLPTSWHTTPLRDLAPARQAPRAGRALETGVLLRAVAILLIVGSHADLWTLVGGAHVLLGVAGFNFARFHLDGRGSPTRTVLRSVARIVVPSSVAIGVAAAVTSKYTLTNVLLLNGIVGPQRWGPTWHFWFVEVLVYLLLAAALLLAVPAVRQAERRWPWGFALVLLGAGVASRFSPGWLPTGPDRIHTAHVLLWLFVLGWATARATTTSRRLLLSGVLLLTVPGFFDNPRRETIVVVGLLALLWVATVRVPAWIASAATVLATASLHIYVTHWLVYPHLEPHSPLAATVASIAVGLLYREADVRVQAAWRRRPAVGASA